MSILRLPSTILYEIFLLVQESQPEPQSKHDLRNFAIVHTSWSDPAARVMDRVLVIATRATLLRNLTQKLATSSTLANRIGRTQSLTLDFGVWKWGEVQWEEAAQLVRSMPILRRFKFTSYSIEQDSVQESFYRLMGALESAESLRELNCRGPNEQSLASHLMNIVSRVQNIDTLVLCNLTKISTAIDWKQFPHPLPIRRLCLESIAVDDAELFTALISKTLPTLSELVLVDFIGDLWDPDELGDAMMEVARSGIVLRALQMTLPGGGPVVWSNALVESIEEFRHLRSLHLRGIPRSSQGQFVSYLQAPIEFLFMGVWDEELLREVEENLRPEGTLRPHLKRLLIAEPLFVGPEDERAYEQAHMRLSILGRACAEVGVQLRLCDIFWGSGEVFGEGIWESGTGWAR